jgi:hypothetical protein
MEEASLFKDPEHVWLISRGAKGEIRCFELWYEGINEIYTIHRESCQFRGKVTKQPDIVIECGKVNRSALAQCILQFNHLIKEKLDKGYKQLEKPFNEYTLNQLDNLLPEYNTDSNGFKKHMLAKSYDKVKESTINKVPYWYASRKIDGLRVSFYWDGKRIKTASRGGGDYDPACQHFIQNKQFIEFFKRHPKCILDSELYKHGKSLQQISGAARLEKNAYDCDWLECYVYDVMYPDMKFETRLKILNQISKELNLGFNPNREWKDGELQIQMVPHVKVSGIDNIMKLHNDYVEEGFEGVVIRDPEKFYGFGRRSNDMIKVKKYKTSEFLVINYELGLRGSEDMVFICVTKDGIQFKAKPWGDREQKEWYIENFETKCKNQMATIKYFYMSDEGCPLQPSALGIRIREDMPI